MQVSLARKGLMTSAKSNNRIMNAARQIGKHSNPSGISMKPLGDFIVTPPGIHSNPSAAVVKPASRRIKTRQSATQYPPVVGSIPASRRRRRQAGIRASSGGSRTSVRRVLGLSCEHFSSMGSDPMEPGDRLVLRVVDGEGGGWWMVMRHSPKVRHGECPPCRK